MMGNYTRVPLASESQNLAPPPAGKILRLAHLSSKLLTPSSG